MTKGTKIDDLATVVATGSGIFGNCALETPYVRFATLLTGQEFIWVSNAASEASWDIPAGSEVTLEAFAYGKRLRRVTVGFRGKTFGMGA